MLVLRYVYEQDAFERHIRTNSPTPHAKVSEDHRRQQFRNRYLMWVKNETRRGLLHDLPHIAAYEVAQLGYVLLRERHLLAGYREARDALPAARERRREVQSRRAVRRVPFGSTPRP